MIYPKSDHIYNLILHIVTKYYMTTLSVCVSPWSKAMDLGLIDHEEMSLK